MRGTRTQINAGSADGLLYAGEPGACPRAASGVQLTWMDAQVEDRVVTPRIPTCAGTKPVGVNAETSRWANSSRESARLVAFARFAVRTHRGQKQDCCKAYRQGSSSIVVRPLASRL